MYEHAEYSDLLISSEQHFFANHSTAAICALEFVWWFFENIINDRVVSGYKTVLNKMSNLVFKK